MNNKECKVKAEIQANIRKCIIETTLKNVFMFKNDRSHLFCVAEIYRLSVTSCLFAHFL